MEDNIFCILYFQYAKSYFCDQHGNVICQPGWKQSKIHKDPLNPCTQPICSQGSTWHRTANFEYTNPEFFFTKMCCLLKEKTITLFFLGNSTCVDLLMCRSWNFEFPIHTTYYIICYNRGCICFFTRILPRPHQNSGFFIK